MDEKQLQALANELAKNLKTPEDLSQFDRLLKKLSVEAALNAEMTHHPGYEKNQTRITGMDNQILSLYAKGMTTREIAAAFKELYDADVSPALISKVT
ncbi:transposase, partial [Escherichia coli]